MLKVKPNPLDEDTIIRCLGGLMYRIYQIHWVTFFIINEVLPKYYVENALLESLLVHCRVINEFFKKPMEYEKNAKKKPKIKEYRADSFCATHCMSDDEYIELYNKLSNQNLFLTKKELKAINVQLLHSSSDEPIFKEWRPAISNNKAVKAFRLFVQYPSVKNLIKQNPRWTRKDYADLVNFLESQP